MTNINIKNLKRTAISDIIYISIFAAIICVCSQISIPLGPIPFTLQTFAVFITAAILGCKRGIICVLVYILLGLSGIPVFAGFLGGISSISLPIFGYIVGFIPMTFIIGLGVKIFGNKIISLIVSMTIGSLSCYLIGTTWFMLFCNIDSNEITLNIALGYCVIPFIIPDIFKIAIAAGLISKLSKIIKI